MTILTIIKNVIGRNNRLIRKNLFYLFAQQNFLQRLLPIAKEKVKALQHKLLSILEKEVIRESLIWTLKILLNRNY